jgi:hypothetical protein
MAPSGLGVALSEKQDGDGDDNADKTLHGGPHKGVKRPVENPLFPGERGGVRPLFLAGSVDFSQKQGANAPRSPVWSYGDGIVGDAVFVVLVGVVCGTRAPKRPTNCWAAGLEMVGGRPLNRACTWLTS